MSSCLAVAGRPKDIQRSCHSNDWQRSSRQATDISVAAGESAGVSRATVESQAGGCAGDRAIDRPAVTPCAVRRLEQKAALFRREFLAQEPDVPPRQHDEPDLRLSFRGGSQGWL